MSSKFERGSFSQQRRSAQSLPSLYIPPLDDSEPVRSAVWEASMETLNEVNEEGEALFKGIIYEEIRSESSVDLERPTVDLLDEEFLRTVNNNNPLYRKFGWNLRQMADQFAKSQQRQQVRQQAHQVVVNITYEQFRDLLSELFGGSITTERIVVLFFFCSDVAINALHTGIDIFQQFIDWSLSFIAEHVYRWVHRHGGWKQVLESQFNKPYKLYAFAGFSVVIGLAFVKYFR